jgi:3-demethoxyubiquinol 3-hydroxylase
MNFVDTLICQLDAGLRTVFAVAPAARIMPRVEAATPSLAANDTATSIRLMRVNHVGEVAAQALYQGQLLVARDSATRGVLEHAAREERDHLAWCQSRINTLGGQTSVLSPIFYAGAWALGVASGLAGDKWSMGFLVETERQVEAHLDTHLEKLPINDLTSRAIIEQMRLDEIEHGNTGEAHGAVSLPAPIKAVMQASSKVMTSTTYWV